MYDASLALAVVVYLAILVWYLRSPVASIFHPLSWYCAFHGLLFVFRPVLARIYDYSFIYAYIRFTPSPADKITVILASTMGFVIFAFTCLATGNVPMRFVNDAAAREERRRYIRPLLWVLAIAGPPAVYSLSKIYASDDAFIFDGIRMDAATGITINTTQIGYVTDMQLMLVSLLAIPLWLARFRPLYFLPVFAFVLLRAGSGGRGPFIVALAVIGLFYLYERRMKRPSTKVMIGAALAFALFSLIGDDRGQSVRKLMGIASQEAEVKRPIAGRLEGMDFGNMEYFEFLVYVIPQRSGTYDYFLDNFQLLTEPVPRIYWPGKPIGEPFQKIFLTQYGKPYGMTKSLPGEGWYAWGWLGVGIWCGLWGLALGAIYRKFVTSAQTIVQTSAYLVFLPTLITGFRDGLLLTVVKQTAFYLAPVLLWLLIARLMGVPSAPMIRRAMARFRPAGGDTPAEPQPAGPGPYLPPAVRRRRLALAQARRSQA